MRFSLVTRRDLIKLLILSLLLLWITSCSFYNEMAMRGAVAEANRLHGQLNTFVSSHDLAVAKSKPVADVATLALQWDTLRLKNVYAAVNAQCLMNAPGNEWTGFFDQDMQLARLSDQEASDPGNASIIQYLKTVHAGWLDKETNEYTAQLSKLFVESASAIPSATAKQIAAIDKRIEALSGTLHPAGWLGGLWDGFRSPVTLVGSFFFADWTVFSPTTKGAEYLLGFWGGVVVLLLLLGGLSTGARKGSE